jgi:UDP-N-acetylmuramoylalanine--D-glutamate ligase
MNWQLDQFSAKDIVFVGVGLGRAMVGIKSFLEKHAAMTSFVGVDKQTADKPLGFLCQYNPKQTVFIKNEAIPGNEMPVPYITPLELFFMLVGQTGATTIGITGTKGKSTTSALTAHILHEAGKYAVLVGNIGVSPFEALDTANDETYFVFELSSYQLSDLTRSPHISACLNLYHDHVNWHGSLENYWEAKHNIVRFTRPEDIFIYNPDFPTLQRWAEKAICQTIAIDSTEQLDLARAQLFGDHNRVNAIIAREIVRQCGVDDTITIRAINSFVPLKHRMQVVATKNNQIYIDDAIGMTPEATSASLRAIHEKFGAIGCVLMGGQDRSYDFSNVMKLVATFKVPFLVLFPDTIAKMRAALPANYQPEIFETRDMKAAVVFAAAHSPKDAAIVLSTAAPSYSIWRDFEEKGDFFQQAVAEL